MKYISLLFVICFTGCNPPQVDSCVTDLNQLDRDLKALPPGFSVDQAIETAHQSKLEYCVPFDTSKPDYSRPLNTGDHTFDKSNYAILFNWVVKRAK